MERWCLMDDVRRLAFGRSLGESGPPLVYQHQHKAQGRLQVITETEKQSDLCSRQQSGHATMGLVVSPQGG